MILVTGGAGYIGSHTVVELVNAGFDVLVLDNLYNSSRESLIRVELITGKEIQFIEGDIRDSGLLNKIFSEYSISGVIHFAGLKAVGESVSKPLSYYEVNVSGTITLLQAMNRAGINNFIFSSSATVYGEDAPVPYIETLPRGKTSNPYGASKSMVEQVLTDFQMANPQASVSLLRYFNPIGAHPSGHIGEDPQGIPNNLMPFIAQVAVGVRQELTVFGVDYPTKDGSCERDYLHVVDLAKGHVAAIQQFGTPGAHVYNLGTGNPVSVLSMVKAFEQVNEVNIPYRIGPRRAGDLPAFWANADKAYVELGWKAQLSLEDMMRDTWHWQSKNPNGYKSS